MNDTRSFNVSSDLSSHSNADKCHYKHLILSLHYSFSNLTAQGVYLGYRGISHTLI